jgi:hypothetical protein
MAHFARIDSEGKVDDLIVVANDVILDENGEESEAVGQAFITSLGFEGTWLQCSYNGSFRGMYPGVGYIYEQERDVFLPPQPYPSWVIDDETSQWVAPVAYPTDGVLYFWDEKTLSWQPAKA